MELITKYSPQQQDVLDFVSNGYGSAFVEAVAGAGKTTTLLGALERTTGSVAFAAYNTKIANEIKAKAAALNLGSRVRIATFHSFGLAAWRRAYKNVVCGPEAAREKADMTIAGMKKAGVPEAIHTFVLRLAGLAKNTGRLDIDEEILQSIIDHHDMAYDIEDEALIPAAVQAALRALKYHRNLGHKIIDFDDMIWLPVTTPIRFWQNDWVFVDEAQDTNAARRMLARKMLSPNGRSVWVGDRHQAIYGFTGADNDAVDLIVREFECMSLPLTTTYRCPKSVVTAAQAIVSHIQAHETAPEGKVTTTWEETVFRPITDENYAADKPEYHYTDFRPTDAILCRKTKPLVSMAYDLIKRGVPCHVEGKEIGAGLLRLVNKWKSIKTLSQLRERLEQFLDTETAKLRNKKKEAQAEALADRVETVFVIMDSQPPASSIDELRSRIQALFQDSDDRNTKPTLTLSTVHKSKGREWPRVFVLGGNLWMPGPWARQDWQVQQEMNLIYVAYTRAQQELIKISVVED